ncbi:hypothetical protein JQ596_38620 [Bradyrhizobium manausense]|uniref:hypothetical protein n=1 Tax=Bradyrhizobium TaxID=374 RepID=UPI001BA79DD9|nr:MULTISPECIES: hypothetical protein [Bradyrhizobium]MBR0831436.1 hypothetical protein [Bradyrhizobium manausense]UVO26916.1 hypothetical protein KUF59_30820 [Bradyrhizobium arachidis]
MIRFAVAGLAMLACAGAVAAEEDNSALLVDLFAKICAPKPALPSQVERVATSLGFVSDGGPITAEMERGPKIDILYMAKLIRRGERIGSMSAYFAGPDDGPSVTCTVTATGVSADALPGLIEKSLKARERADKPSNDENHRLASWRVGTGSGDTLDMSVWRTSPRRASISIGYVGYKR